jgi:hypothetical protein
LGSTKGRGHDSDAVVDVTIILKLGLKEIWCEVVREFRAY